MKLPAWLKRKPSKVNLALRAIVSSLRTSDSVLIALARLTFIKPADLIREAQNVKSNAEYLVGMTEARKKLLKEKKKK